MVVGSEESMRGSIAIAAAMAQEGDVVSGKRRCKPPKKKTREKKVKPKKTRHRSQQAPPPPITNKVEDVVLDMQSHHEEQVAEEFVGDAQSHHEDQVADEVVFDLGSDSVVHEHEEGSLEPAPARYVRVGAAVQNVTVTTTDALQCGLCFLALRPPIFQCEVGHVVCSTCRDKLEATGDGKCHVCGVATRGYYRCHAMEQLVDCIRVPCPYAAHGCDATAPYHNQETHSQVCLYAPCHCPGESCGFIGSTAALLHHFTGAHDWACTSKVRTGETFSIRLHLGFNFILHADQDRDDDDEQAAGTGSVLCRLFLLNVTQEWLGRAISVLCIHPHASTAANGAQQLLSTQCELVFSRYGDGSSYHSHYQSSVFDVVCTDLSSGLPNPEGCFQFIVPNAVLGDDDDKSSIQVKARIIN